MARVPCHAPVSPPIYKCHIADRQSNVVASWPVRLRAKPRAAYPNTRIPAGHGFIVEKTALRQDEQLDEGQA